MRYTEVRMQKLTNELLADIEKETVDFQPNYDESLSEPKVLPTRFPNLLVNGSEGIAVGMATKIPPHNLTEILDATIALVKKPEITIDELIKIVPGPDFPTAGFIYGRDEIHRAYREGRGIIQMRARAGIDRIGRGEREKDAVVVTEIPYQVNKARLIEKIAELVHEKKLDGISELRDESNREGMRIVIELKRDAIPQVVLNKLYKLTPMQSSFGIYQYRDHRRTAEGFESQTDARSVCFVSPRSRPPPHRVRIAQSTGAGAYLGRLEQSDRRARLHHSADSQFAFG
jgi:DNA gyrase subunit A